MQPRLLLSLLALLLLAVLGCRGTPDKTVTLNSGNMVITVVPKKITQPKLLVIYDSGSQKVFAAGLDASGGNFEIRSADGWYPLEASTRIEVTEQGAGDSIVLIDSKAEPIDILSKVTDLETEFIANAATGDWYEFDDATKTHKFAVYLLFKDAIHVIDIRAKD